MSWIFRYVTLVCVILLFLMISCAGEEAVYYLTEQDGFVAVQEGENGTLLLTDIRIDCLPLADRTLLQQKIPCGSKAELAAVLENFDS